MNESAELSAAAAAARVIPSSRDTDESWRRCCRRLRAELGENVFTSWFGRLKLDSIEEGRAQFSVPTRFLKSWIEAHYSDRIFAALEAEIGGIASVAIGLRSSMGGSVAPPATAVPDQPKAIDPARQTAARVASASAPHGGVLREEAAMYHEALASSPLDRRLTFASFLVGRSNQLAYSAAQRVVEDRAGQTPAFSPLYVHSAVGLGKTHLLQATAEWT
jgi:chromosomal replication initiator protein